MEGQQWAIVHFVDMVTRKNQNLFGRVGADDVQILVDGVGCSLVPLAADSLRGWQYFNELPLLRFEFGPATHQVRDQGMGLVLGQHQDLPDPGIDAV